MPGSGRRRGTRNRRIVAAVALASELMNDVEYQYRFRRDFTRRRVHPSIETLIWHYVAGKPKESIQMTGSMGFSERLEAERQLFSQLDVKQLEVLAAESQALVDRAMAMVKANALTPGAATVPRAPVNGGESNGEPGETGPTSTRRSKAPLAFSKRADACNPQTQGLRSPISLSSSRGVPSHEGGTAWIAEHVEPSVSAGGISIRGRSGDARVRLPTGFAKIVRPEYSVEFADA